MVAIRHPERVERLNTTHHNPVIYHVKIANAHTISELKMGFIITETVNTTL